MAISIPKANAQSQEVQQLLLNVEKLAQFKKILQDMYDGYKVLENGYQKVKAVASGNYKLHQVFLDGLLAVSPEVRNYYKIVLIIEDQVRLVKEYKVFAAELRTTNVFTAGELGFFDKVYQGLLDESLSNLSTLLTIVTAGQVRMSDDERIQALDQLANEMKNKLLFLRQFNHGAQQLGVNRLKEQTEINLLRKWHGLQNQQP